MNHHEYLVVYRYAGNGRRGTGRSVITVDAPIRNASEIKAVESELSAASGMECRITSCELTRSYND